MQYHPTCTINIFTVPIWFSILSIPCCNNEKFIITGYRNIGIGGGGIKFRPYQEQQHFSRHFIYRSMLRTSIRVFQYASTSTYLSTHGITWEIKLICLWNFDNDSKIGRSSEQITSRTFCLNLTKVYIPDKQRSIPRANGKHSEDFILILDKTKLESRNNPKNQ
jgi:hypothetical protein